MNQYTKSDQDNPLIPAYGEMDNSRPLGPRPADTGNLTMQQAVMRCHYQGISPSRVNVERLMHQFPVEVTTISRQGN